MAEEIDGSVSYLKALKQSSGSGEATGAAPARERTSETKVTPRRFPGTEKRRSVRYKCEGGAGVREEGADVQTWARFTDISLHGYYIEAQSTYPVGAVLYLRLEANGVRVESKGMVRVSYPCLGMGIAFIDPSEETRQRLKEMLGGITRPTGPIGPGIASSPPAGGAIGALPEVHDPKAALRALIEFFENRQLLMRDDFLKILRTSRGPALKP
ncbi:MAG TPA: PilZ domain-containing protein [Candidatus Sulfotelmatobacter sp.]|jgi:hypothetical protein